VREQAREISKIDKLKQSQEHAMLAAARVEAAEGSIGVTYHRHMQTYIIDVCRHIS
jgi:hypothetical protein